MFDTGVDMSAEGILCSGGSSSNLAEPVEELGAVS